MNNESCLSFVGWKPGQWVRIKKGVFVGKQGVILPPVQAKSAASDPLAPFLLVEVRAFGGKAILTFTEADEVERIHLPV